MKRQRTAGTPLDCAAEPTPEVALLLALQLSDSAFPSGGFAFSWGLEAALSAGRVDPTVLRAWAVAELQGRWHGIDRIAHGRGHRLRGADLQAAAQAFDLQMSLEGARCESLTAGAALLASARALGIATDPGLLIENHGHFPLVQGAVMAGLGLPLTLSLPISASTALRGIYSAALRLGRTGAIAMHKDLIALAPLVARLSADLPDPEDEPAGFAPLSDIALMRPLPDRLFIN